jgi:hypothetical protein
MNATRRLIATALTMISLAIAYLTIAGTAGAMPEPPPERGTVVNQSPPATTTTVVNHTGSAIWTYIVVAIATALITLALAWTVAQLRRAHSRAGSAHAQTA